MFTCINALCSNVTVKAKGTELMLLQLLRTNLMLGVRWIILVGKKNHSDIF